jgi:hypothetical protein
MSELERLARLDSDPSAALAAFRRRAAAEGLLEVANECESVDVGQLAAALDEGRARRCIFDDWEIAKTDEVQGSPHLFLPDGSSVHSPGVTHHWEGDFGIGFPVVDSDDPTVYDDLLRRAAG